MENKKHEFELGDTVVLKSGGPQMTIKKLDTSSSGDDIKRAHCLWFNNCEVLEGAFPLHTLKPS